MPDKPFQLRVVHRGDADYGLALHRRPPTNRRTLDVEADWPLVVRTWGTPLKSVTDQVLSVIKSAGYRATDLTRSRQTPFELTELQGVRLGLLFLAVKPLRKVARMSSIADQLRSMADEEAYYWFSKTTSNGTSRRGQRAMRVLLAED